MIKINDKYTHQAVDVAFNYLNNKYNTNISWANYDEHKNNSWQVYGIDINSELPA